MKIRVVTDSTADIDPRVVDELGIAVVPSYVKLGTHYYRDGIDISKDKFYRGLLESPVYPVTSEATSADFAQTYSKLSEESDGIISIHVSAKVSETIKSARKGSSRVLKRKYPIEIIDSHSSSVGLGLLVNAVAQMANSGARMHEILEVIPELTAKIHMLGIVDTLKYPMMGGKISKSLASMYGVFQVKPLLTFEDGQVVPAGLVHAHQTHGGVDRLYEFANIDSDIDEIGVGYTSIPEQAAELKQKLLKVVPEDRISVMQINSAIGSHLGPASMVIAYRQA